VNSTTTSGEFLVSGFPALNNGSDLQPLRDAIKNVAVGKNGSKPIPEEILPEVNQVLDRIHAELADASYAIVQEAVLLQVCTDLTSQNFEGLT
jgi:hypothetical protein